MCPALRSAGSGGSGGLLMIDHALGWSGDLARIPGAGAGTGLGFPWSRSAPRPRSRGARASPAVVFQLQLWQLPQHPSPEESEQYLQLGSAGSTCGMPLITLLIGFLSLPSIFSKQKAGGSRCYLLFHNKCCSCGDQRSRNCGALFPFYFFPENCSKTFNPLEKARN